MAQLLVQIGMPHYSRAKAQGAKDVAIRVHLPVEFGSRTNYAPDCRLPATGIFCL